MCKMKCLGQVFMLGLAFDMHFFKVSKKNIKSLTKKDIFEQHIFWNKIIVRCEQWLMSTYVILSVTFSQNTPVLHLYNDELFRVAEN